VSEREREGEGRKERVWLQRSEGGHSTQHVQWSNKTRVAAGNHELDNKQRTTDSCIDDGHM
jgi:hypothetical protein